MLRSILAPMISHLADLLESPKALCSCEMYVLCVVGSVTGQRIMFPSQVG